MPFILSGHPIFLRSCAEMYKKEENAFLQKAETELPAVLALFLPLAL